MEVPVVAGTVSTVLFASSMAPMLAHTVYILSLPAGACSSTEPALSGSDSAKALIASEALP
jgi:hypothetical protein